MYLRFGWVVGNVGLVQTLVIVVLATSITFLTSLSIAAIATNAPVKAGGAYYMISRSLGIEIGGAVGIPLFLAQAFSVALYVIGFSESLRFIFPAIDVKLVGLITTLILGALALISTKAAIKSQFVVLGIIGLSLLSLAFGSPLSNVEITPSLPAPNGAPFWVVFAVFFPAVTGIMAGVNLSGDLKDPAKSIPRGTFMAVGVGFVVYMLIPLVLASRADTQTLLNNPLVMEKISLIGGAIFLGVWGATLSSAVGSLLGAPRILQALASDQVLPKAFSFFERESGKERIPKAGTIFTIIITLVSVYLGDLNLLAPILTMFFLTTYAVLNLTAGLERFLKSPSYRPKFKVHWVFSMLGALGCGAVMFLINPAATFGAFVFITMVFVWLKRRGMKTAMGGVRRGVLISLIRYAALRLDKTGNAKGWRPNLLVLSGAPTKRWHLIDFANSITQSKALFTVATILQEDKVPLEKVPHYEQNIAEYLNQKKVSALVRVIRATHPYEGSKQLVNAYGLGALVPNTVLLGASNENTNQQPYAQLVQHIYQSSRNLIIVQDEHHTAFGNKKSVDIWWGGLKGNGALLMVLGYLLKSGRQWPGVEINVKMAVKTADAAEKALSNLREKLQSMRIDFNTDVLVLGEESFWDVMQRESQNSDLSLIGMAPPTDDFNEYFQTLKNNTSSLGAKVFVLATTDIEFSDVLV